MITAWRIAKARWRHSAFDGRGAATFPGRWNQAGDAMVYAAQSRSLASLELLVHTEDTHLLSALRLLAIPVSFAESLVEVPSRLPDDWRTVPAPESTRAFGHAWIASGRSAVLRVPSVVTGGEFNYLLNPRHPDFARLRVGAAEPFAFDGRLRAGPAA